MPETLPLSLINAGPKPEIAYKNLPAIGDLGNRPSAPAAPVEALYVHMPFCTSKCHYCDFYSVAGHLDQADDFLNALERELDLQTRHFGPIAPQTIFIGGGTPTLLDPARLARMLSIVRTSLNPHRLIEFTVEANPNTFDQPRAAALAAAGVNRISFGAQSFIPSELITLQRDHDPANVAPAVALARAAGIHNINLDLIFGIPGQTLASWQFSLNQALALNPNHLSCYSLMYEPNTAMTARLNKGDFQRCDESLELDMLDATCHALTHAGFERYEISNYARLPAGQTTGQRCLHNMHYWTGSNYLAVGPSAAAHHSGFRWKNVSALNRYLDALSPPTPIVPIVELEHLQGFNRWGELAMLRLRLRDGLIFSDFHQRTGTDARQILKNVLHRYAGLDLFTQDAQRLALTENAIPVSNRLLSDVLEAFTNHTESP